MSQALSYRSTADIPAYNLKKSNKRFRLCQLLALAGGVFIFKAKILHFSYMCEIHLNFMIVNATMRTVNEKRAIRTIPEGIKSPGYF